MGGDARWVTPHQFKMTVWRSFGCPHLFGKEELKMSHAGCQGWTTPAMGMGADF